MVDNLSLAQRSGAMRRVKSKNTSPELSLRRLLRQLGFRGYRLHGDYLPGKPDIIWIGRKLALFVHGCFWHGHDCPRGARIPKTNTDYWLNKIDKNRKRDTLHLALLESHGWRVLIVWECELKNQIALTEKLGCFLSSQTPCTDNSQVERP